MDMAFCFILLPLVIYAFPVERWWGTYPLFFCSFVGWLYVTYFLYKYFIVPRLFIKGKKRTMAVVAILLSLAVTFLFSAYEITSPLYHIHQQQRQLYPYHLGHPTEPASDMVALHLSRYLLLCRRHVERGVSAETGAGRDGI